MFLKISQYPHENAKAGRYMPFTEHLRWLLLDFCGRKCFFQLTLVFIADGQINTYALILVSKFTVSFANTPYATIDTAIIRSSRPVLFYKKDFRRKHKKGIPLQMFSCERCFYINTHSVYCPTTTFRLFKNDVKHIFWMSIFSG